MDSLKTRMTAMKKQMDEYDERELKAKVDLEKQIERLKIADSETDQLKRRIQKIASEVHDVKEKLVNKVEYLSEVEVVLAEKEECCKELKERDEDNTIRIEDLEHKLQLLKVFTDETERKQQDASNRLSLGMNDLRNLRERTNEKCQRIDTMEKHCLKGKSSFEAMQLEKDKMAEREDALEEMRRSLEEKCKHASLREEEASRKQKILQYAIEIENDRCDAKRLECQKQERKLEMMKKEMGDMYG